MVLAKCLSFLDLQLTNQVTYCFIFFLAFLLSSFVTKKLRRNTVMKMFQISGCNAKNSCVLCF